MCDRNNIETNANIVHTRFVCTWKIKENLSQNTQIKQAKARLVALGYEEDVTHEAVDSPTGTKEGMRLLLWFGVKNKYDIYSCDGKRAFLQSEKRKGNEKSIYLVPPREAGEASNVLWKLRVSLYGLRSAPKAWFITLKNKLIQLGFKQSKNDIAMFM